MDKSQRLVQQTVRAFLPRLGMLGRIANAALRLIQHIASFWMELQVELHGQYSPQRVRALHDYCVKTPWWRVTLVCLFTPFPCLLLVIITDAIPLADPTSGILNNYVYWCRNTVGCAFISLTVLEQFRGCLPRLELYTTTILFISVTSTLLTTFFQMGCASLIGFPLPFTFFFAAMIWTPAIILQIMFVSRQSLRVDAKLRTDFIKYLIVFFCQISLTIVYPAYMSVFVGLEGAAQTVFFLLLPVIKILNKNWISRFLPNNDDVKPEVIIFNIEIFHALYISCALQNVSSTGAMLVIMAIDLVLIWLAISDVNVLLVEINKLVTRLQGHETINLLRLISDILDDPLVTSDAHFRDHHPSTLQRVATKPWLPSLRATVHPHESAIQNSSLTAVGPRVDDMKLLGQPRTEDKLEFISKTAQMLFITEFVILIEFTEVIVPIMYSIFLTAMSQLPNRAYYPQLAPHDQQHLVAIVSRVFLYSALEFLSFALITVLLKRKLTLSTLHQLAFVLEKQWVLVQSKLILWTFFVIESSIVHFGTDFSFEFAWLHSK